MGTLIRPPNNSNKRWPEPKALVDSTNRQLNHSPVDSPPTVKKKLCRLAKGLFADSSSAATHRGALASLDAAFVSDAPAVELAQIALGSVPASSLRRLERCNSLTTKGASILKKGKLLRASIRAKSHSWPPHKSVKFHDDVTVIRINDDGEYVCTECAQLQAAATQPDLLPGHSVRDRQLYMLRSTPQRLMRRSQSPPAVREPHAAQVNAPTTEANAKQQTEKEEPWSPDHQANPATSASSTSTTTNGVNFSFVEDPLHGLKLKFSVPLGAGYGPSDIVVKANMSGNRIRVVASRSSGAGHRSSFEQFNERYPLPMDVDPYMVTARLDVKGQLIVEAPLMTLARRNSFDNGRQKTAQAAEQAFGAV
ncbi:hypothetical protein CAPTEDRAFT_227790 [Capitella teleta]|uniref:Uncharacterized protein n=1 Tax=Capitella teleta TaxID=283909 RepID=R7VJ69_CAPTE|nr:hypothetical protein CAPTEDRAFT_227790 [Capitella teleta]|eukprot:ELU16381.1 hypothetical protein CAPTEDRAFT_227790 [Capitella teleta]